jgi:hypothetical protein
MKAYCKSKLITYSIAALTLLSFCLPAPAFVLDVFNSKTGWTDDANSGTANVAAGVLTITTATGNGAIKSSVKTASPTSTNVVVNPPVFTPKVGDTLELWVDANKTFNPALETNALAVLAWVPTGGTALNNGYALLVGGNDIILQHDTTVVWSTNFAGVATDFGVTNATLCLRITPVSGGGVDLNVRVYKQIGQPPGAPGQANLAGVSGLYFTAGFEYTAHDSDSSLVGQTGNAAVGVENQANPAGSSVVFDNLQAWDIINSVLDNFDSNPGLNGWTPFVLNPADTVAVAGGGGSNVVHFVSHYTAAVGAGFCGLVYSGRTFFLGDGSRLEFAIDLVQNFTGANSYGVLGFVPGSGSTAINNLFRLIEYHLSSDSVAFYNGKAYGNWWGNQAVPGGVDSHMRYRITLTGEGTSVRIESRAEDLSKDRNDPTYILYQNMRVDTIAQDQNEASGAKLPYLVPGSFAIDCFISDSATAISDIVMDNAVINQTLPPNLPPIANNLLPAQGANFVPSSSHITATLSDDNNVVPTGVYLTLNGVTYTTASNGVGGVNFTLNPPSGTVLTRTLDVSGVLADNTFYTGNLTLVDQQGASNVTAMSFDTFTNGIFVVESEEYNFTNSAYATTFLDNPEVLAEGDADACCAYNGQLGRPEIDFHSHRGTGSNAGYDTDHTFRYIDVQRTLACLDPQRLKYKNAPGNPSHSPPTGGLGGWNEEEVGDINDGDWLNYTHNYPAGAYKVYLRQAQSILSPSLVTLDLVTSDPNSTGQTTVTLGSFVGTDVSGVGKFRDVPLSDGLGNPIVLKFDGTQKTLRISQHQTGNASSSTGSLEQNYIAFVPTADPGTQRPIVSSASPVPGSFNINNRNGTIVPTSLTVANRDTSVDPNSIVLKLNGVTMPITKTTLTGGVQVDWPFASTPGAALITAMLTFSDTASVPQTFSWSYSYPWLAASNSLPVGTLTARGWDYFMVQSSTVGGAGNALGTAEEQLTGLIPYDQSYTTNAPNGIQLLQWSVETGVVSPTTGSVINQAPPNLAQGPEIDNIACQMLGYMHLTAGAHRFYVLSDDGFQLRSGTTPSDTAATVMGFRDGGTINGYFDFLVEAEGLYPSRCLWMQHGGQANFEMSSVNLSDNSKHLINDPANPTGVVEVYLADGPVAQVIQLYSSSTVKGTYAIDNTAVIDTNAKTATVPISGSARFYRFYGPNQVTITKISKVGSNIVLAYQ